MKGLRRVTDGLIAYSGNIMVYRNHICRHRIVSFQAQQVRSTSLGLSFIFQVSIWTKKQTSWTICVVLSIIEVVYIPNMRHLVVIENKLEHRQSNSCHYYDTTCWISDYVYNCRTGESFHKSDVFTATSFAHREELSQQVEPQEWRTPQIQNACKYRWSETKKTAHCIYCDCFVLVDV